MSEENAGLSERAAKDAETKKTAAELTERAQQEARDNANKDTKQ